MHVSGYVQLQIVDIIAFDVLEMEVLTTKDLPRALKEAPNTKNGDGKAAQHKRRCIYQLVKELELLQFFQLSGLGKSKGSSKRVSPSP